MMKIQTAFEFWSLANSIYSRTDDLIRNNKISFNHQMHIVNVQITKEVRVVKLYSKENCTPTRSEV